MTKTFKAYDYTENKLDENTVRARLGDALVAIQYESSQPVLVIKREKLADAAKILRDDPALAYNYFTDITAGDNSKRDDFEPEKRFQVIAILYSINHKRRVRLKVYVPEADPTCPSLTGVFEGANLTEREAYEMFGVRFTGHPNLKRLLTPEYMKDYPLRKEYPVTGKGERDNFPQYEEIQ